ncbi:MAG TPA: hypothetical protein PLW30_01345, partial [Candidatus Saccharicenans sp.]|nr:hypothetical protein [Candidatus Saccharicenans sp.]HQI21802.1 hypothetical protein [Candidatus Saccharicenans sp.]
MNFLKFKLKPEVSNDNHSFPGPASRLAENKNNRNPLLLLIITLTALLFVAIRVEARVTRADYERAL